MQIAIALFIQIKSNKMITDNSNGRLAEIKAFAKENNLMESFKNTFLRLENYSGKGYDVTLLTSSLRHPN